MNRTMTDRTERIDNVIDAVERFQERARTVANIAVLVDLTERYGMPAPIGDFRDSLECGCPTDLAVTNACCERGRRREGIPVPPMPYGVGMYVPHNRD